MRNTTISRVENGIVNPTFTTLLKYANILEITFEEMLDTIDYCIEVDDSFDTYNW